MESRNISVRVPKPLFDASESEMGSDSATPIFDAGTQKPLSDQASKTRLEAMARRGEETLSPGTKASVTKTPDGFNLAMKGTPKPADEEDFEEEEELSAGEKAVSAIFDDSENVVPELLRRMTQRRDEAARQRTMTPYTPPDEPPVEGLEPVVDDKGRINMEGTAAAFKNPSVYAGLEGQAYQDAAQADFDNYFGKPEASGVISHSEYSDERVGTVHVFERDDGVDVKFAETPDGNLYNVTDVI
jgi:hypothetical protein